MAEREALSYPLGSGETIAWSVQAEAGHLSKKAHLRGSIRLISPLANSRFLLSTTARPM
jgi:hypothetical protein